MPRPDEGPEVRSIEELRRLFPPRTESVVRPESLPRLRGFVAQYKYNDIRVLIDFLPGGKIELLTRRREPVREYRLTPAMRAALLSLKLDRSRYHALDGGVFRYLSVDGESPLVLWDVLVHDNRYLTGTSYDYRYRLLRKICRSPASYERSTGKRVGLEIRDADCPLWLAPVFTRNFRALFQNTLDASYLEGLLLKDAKAPLEPGLRELNNFSWQIKVRKSRKDYMY